MRLAEGANFTIDLDEGVATLRVWKRPDLSFEEGARLALTIRDHVVGLVGSDASEARGFIMDLRDAPTLTGKQTRATLGEIVRACEAASCPVGVLLSPGVQRATLEEALSGSGPTRARIFAEPSAARAWIAAGS
ncbi:MAG: hypothetical protein KIS78_29440 [Labilithrix sp.]|nr:hypothetical protein [Labilithrix sp.]MCW5836559.1 hypothetical protein [Labilithrix sp.]